MQLINKLLGRPVAPARAETSQFQESEANPEGGSRNSSRRELVQVVVRDCMRHHGIPSDWIEGRILSVASRTTKARGMHLQLIVRDGTDRLLPYVPAFQASLMQGIARFDPRCEEWLFSVSWQFRNVQRIANPDMPDPAVWASSTTASLVPSGAALAAASATREAPQSVPADLEAVAENAFAETDDGRTRTGEEEVLEDLQALYAIRDASLRNARPAAGATVPVGPSGERDFESTHPGGDAAPAGSAKPRRW